MSAKVGPTIEQGHLMFIDRLLLSTVGLAALLLASCSCL